jgi:prepilin-type N-terminal cleavage/methylation domain-containing protein
MMRREGFTLVELIIVVAILGILGAVALPTYQGHTAKARVSAAKGSLHALRAQIELYKMQHSGRLPGDVNGSQATTAALRRQFVGTSAQTGQAVDSRIPVDPFLYGPYIFKLPENTFNGKSNIAYSTDFATDVGVVDSGWLYNRTTGQIYLNYPGTDEEGVAYIEY